MLLYDYSPYHQVHVDYCIIVGKGGGFIPISHDKGTRQRALTL
ncbi:hypothetical protein yaldo0001_8770 [Yersinia aldovae ATCC 35236]|nr:hypothetical protein yaldo0001_8770 [Yersinia aldovae ATCC 35236]